jgi:dCMP deaminase
MNWKNYFLNIAEQVKFKSKDESTQIGAVIVGKDKEILSTGYNSFPRGLRDDLPERQERPQKYFWIEHAERNAVYNAARIGVSLKGSAIYLTSGLPCADCARAVIQSGIKRIVSYNRDFPGKKLDWDIHFIAASEMLKEAGVEVVFVNENGEVQEIINEK